MNFINEKSIKSIKREAMKKLAEEIVEELLINRKARPWQKINYAEFLELYEQYQDQMSESEFGSMVLEIDHRCLKKRTDSNNIKN